MAYIFDGPDVIGVQLPLVCDGDWHDLDLDQFIAHGDELTHSNTYLNCESGYEVGAEDAPIELVCPNCSSRFDGTVKVPGVGRLRIRMVREEHEGKPEDPTFYFDLHLHRGMSVLDTRSMFELAEKGRGQHWQYRVTNATGVTLSTRFVKEATQLGRVTL